MDSLEAIYAKLDEKACFCGPDDNVLRERWIVLSAAQAIWLEGAEAAVLRAKDLEPEDVIFRIRALAAPEAGE